MPKDAENWVARLRASGPELEVAITQLRTILLRGVAAACQNRYSTLIATDDG